MWGPPSDVCWFINLHNYSYLRTINHSYWSYWHQLNAILGAPHCNTSKFFWPIPSRNHGTDLPATMAFIVDFLFDIPEANLDKMQTLEKKCIFFCICMCNNLFILYIYIYIHCKYVYIIYIYIYVTGHWITEFPAVLEKDASCVLWFATNSDRMVPIGPDWHDVHPRTPRARCHHKTLWWEISRDRDSQLIPSGYD